MQRLVTMLAVLMKTRALLHGLFLSTASAAIGQGTAPSSGNDNVCQEFERTCSDRKEDWCDMTTTRSVMPTIRSMQLFSLTGAPKDTSRPRCYEVGDHVDHVKVVESNRPAKLQRYAYCYNREASGSSGDAADLDTDQQHDTLHRLVLCIADRSSPTRAAATRLRV